MAVLFLFVIVVIFLTWLWNFFQKKPSKEQGKLYRQAFVKRRKYKFRLYLAILYINNGFYRQSESLLSVLRFYVVTNEDKKAVYYFLADVYYHQGNYERAQKLLLKSIDISTKDTTMELHLLACCARDNDEKNLANDALERLVDVGARENVEDAVNFYIGMKDMDRAKQDLKKLQRNLKNSTTAKRYYVLAAKIAHMEGDKKKREHYLKKYAARGGDEKALRWHLKRRR